MDMDQEEKDLISMYRQLNQEWKEHLLLLIQVAISSPENTE